eukprot:13494663-Ditylum_brightwellii.AAC.1
MALSYKPIENSSQMINVNGLLDLTLSCCQPLTLLLSLKEGQGSSTGLKHGCNNKIDNNNGKKLIKELVRLSMEPPKELEENYKISSLQDVMFLEKGDVDVILGKDKDFFNKKKVIYSCGLYLERQQHDQINYNQ